MTDLEIGLGMHVRDRISGYEGIVTDVGYHLTGCVRLGVMPVDTGKTSHRGDTEFFYPDQLEIVHEETEFTEAAENALTREDVDFWLGDCVEDSVTGFRGVASTITVNLYNCPRVAVQPRVGSDTILPGGDDVDVDREWFDTPRVSHLNAGVSDEFEDLMGEESTQETGSSREDLVVKEDRG